MKKEKQLKVKLQLNKITIAKLNEHQMIALKGGNQYLLSANIATDCASGRPNCIKTATVTTTTIGNDTQ